MNLFSAENRLPNRCVDGPTPGGGQPNANQCACNTQVWADHGSYKPSVLYDFYVDQFTLLERLLPDKDQSYMLIQAGFPIVNEFGEYPEQIPPPRHPFPDGDDQTQEVVRLGNVHLGERFAVQHNGRPVPPPATAGSRTASSGARASSAGSPACRRPTPGTRAIPRAPTPPASAIPTA